MKKLAKYFILSFAVTFSLGLLFSYSAYAHAFNECDITLMESHPGNNPKEEKKFNKLIQSCPEAPMVEWDECLYKTAKKHFPLSLKKAEEESALCEAKKELAPHIEE